ncbi:MAG: hypothetical protein EBS58_04800 [Micrococcales bacterium]|nr:hypothetical protein [Micrococcales bacterium]
MASRRRRRKSIGKVIVDVERRVRRVEKRPGAKRLKTNVVTTEKLGYRAVTTKVIQADAVTANEAAFGVTVVSNTDPDIVKEGTTVVDPDTGAQKVYSESLVDYIPVTDPVAQATAESKNAIYYQDAQPTGGTYEVGDMWIDTNDNDKLYTWDGAAWSLTASNQITAVNTNGITVYSGANASSGARIVMNSAGIAGFDATSTNASTGATFSISASTGEAIFKGSIQSGSSITGAAITGSSFTSTNYTSGTGVAITSSSGIDEIKFKVGGVEKASFAIVSGGLVVTSGSAQLTMTSLGAISLSSATTTLLMSAAPYFTTGSGSNTGGVYGSIRNTWASSGDPSGGDLGDVWLKWV